MAINGISVLAILILSLADFDSSMPRVDPSDFQACGPCCLYMACLAKGIDVDFKELTSGMRLGPNGETSLHDLEQISIACGLVPVGAHVEADFARNLPAPFIAHIKLENNDVDHFVLVVFASKDHVIYIDPPYIARFDSMEHFKKNWTGNVLAFANSDIDAQSLRSAIRWASWRSFVRAALTATFVAMTGTAGLMAWSLRRRR